MGARIKKKMVMEKKALVYPRQQPVRFEKAAYPN